MTPSSVASFYGSLEGRISRRGLALGVLLPFLVGLVFMDAANSAAVSVLFWSVIAWPLLVATPWKRLQDTGRTGKWNLVFLPFYVLGFTFFLAEYASVEGGWATFFDGQPPATTDDQLTASGLGGFSTVLIFLPIQFFWLYVIPGNRGDNRYGPPPRPSE